MRTARLDRICNEPRWTDSAAKRRLDIATMSLLLLITRAFVNTFGITQPSVQGERRAAFFIGGLLGLVGLGMIAALTVFITVHR